MKRQEKIKWFYQDMHNGLGNMIMATPMLRVLYKIHKKPINIHFYDKSIRSLFVGAPFLNILKNRPRCKWSWSSEPMYGRGSEQSDIEYNIEVHCGKKFLSSIEPAYVDLNNTMTLKRKKNKKYIAIFNGCLNKQKRKQRRKEIPIDCRDYIVQRCLDLGFIPVILGSRSDYKNFWRHNDIIGSKSVVNYLGKLSLKKTVSILNQCDNFISNDTGLYHVAGALKKNGLVLWRGTDFYKNATTFKGIKRVENRKHVKKIYNKMVNKHLEELL